MGSSLQPGTTTPESEATAFLNPAPGLPVREQVQKHEVPEGFLVKKKSVLGGLHHEYRFERVRRDADEVFVHRAARFLLVQY
jgi:hypothetical protein